MFLLHLISISALSNKQEKNLAFGIARRERERKKKDGKKKKIKSVQKEIFCYFLNHCFCSFFLVSIFDLLL